MARPLSRTQVLWIIAALFWAFVAMLSLAQVWWLAQQVGERINLRSQVLAQSVFYGLWIPVTVVVWRVTARWDLGQSGWPAWIGRHLLLMIGVSVTQGTAFAAFGVYFLSTRPEPFLPALANSFRSRMYLQVLIYVAVVGTGQAMILHDRWRERERRAAQLEAQLADARLDSLRTQLHPHFLFNSLHTIASLVRDNRNADAVRLISGMSDLLRRVLSADQPRIALDEDIALTRRYLEIQDARFGDRIRSTIDVDPSLTAALVPALMVQPLVENAIRHGLSPQVEGGTLTVRAERRGPDLCVTVVDTGVGVPDRWTLASATGTGLGNLRDRLDALYGPRAVLRAGGAAGGGFRVEVIVPLDRA